jgi:hypothetical protein
MFKEGGWLHFDRGGGGCIFRVDFIYYYDGYVFIIRLNMGYVYLQRYHSFIIFVYLNFICGIVHVYLVISLSFQCVVFLMFGRLCHMCVLCQVCLGCHNYFQNISSARTTQKTQPLYYYRGLYSAIA